MDKIFAIGDIHGCLGKLERLINDIPADPEKDTLVFVGDYIDRSAGGKDVIDFILSLKISTATLSACAATMNQCCFAIWKESTKKCIWPMAAA